MTVIRPGMPPVPTPAQAGAAVRAQQARAMFFQTMQAQQAGAAVQAPVQFQAPAASVATARVTATAAPDVRAAALAMQAEAAPSQDGAPRLRRPGSLLNILV